jgi:superfamily I DNA/RNA helicase
VKRTLVLGGPGCGKTHRLLRVMEAALARGVDPSRVAFVSFTRAAVEEARTRACERFALQPRDLPYFRTVHSLAFRELGLRRTDVVGEEQLGEIGAALGELFTGEGASDGPAAGRNADPLLTLDHYARTTMTSLRAAWDDHGGQVEWFRLKRFSDAYALYKRDRDVLDFTDMLERYVASELPAAPVEVGVVDEVQDLTLLQHAAIRKAFADASELWFAGDDDQSIHRWAGAAEDYFLAMDFEREVLPLSHRLPGNIFDLAQGVVGQIGRRFAKDQGASRPGGHVEWVASADEVDLRSGRWLLLARTRSQLQPLVSVAREQGVVYALKKEPSVRRDHVRAIQAHESLRAGKRVEGADAAAALLAAGVRREVDEASTYTAAELGYDARPIWHDALVRIPLEDREYYLACLRRGEKLTEPPRVRIETIHGAKGAEADNVLLVTDLTYRTHRGYELDPDSEHRVLYVGLTRASASLYMVAPQTAYGYPL